MGKRGANKTDTQRRRAKPKAKCGDTQDLDGLSDELEAMIEEGLDTMVTWDDEPSPAEQADSVEASLPDPTNHADPAASTLEPGESAESDMPESTNSAEPVKSEPHNSGEPVASEPTNSTKPAESDESANSETPAASEPPNSTEPSGSAPTGSGEPAAAESAKPVGSEPITSADPAKSEPIDSGEPPESELTGNVTISADSDAFQLVPCVCESDTVVPCDPPTATYVNESGLTASDIQDMDLNFATILHNFSCLQPYRVGDAGVDTMSPTHAGVVLQCEYHGGLKLRLGSGGPGNS